MRVTLEMQVGQVAIVRATDHGIEMVVNGPLPDPPAAEPGYAVTDGCNRSESPVKPAMPRGRVTAKKEEDGGAFAWVDLQLSGMGYGVNGGAIHACVTPTGELTFHMLGRCIGTGQFAGGAFMGIEWCDQPPHPRVMAWLPKLEIALGATLVSSQVSS